MTNKREKEKCFNTQPPEGGWAGINYCRTASPVSTHSRLKAAGLLDYYYFQMVYCFNTQPPEGGWIHCKAYRQPIARFNTQPPEGGWLKIRLGFHWI